MTTKPFLVKAFSSRPEEGNLAGVVADAAGLADSEMQQIAKSVGASETAFVFPSAKNKFKIRWFTPNNEVGLCIHATISAIAVLKSLDRITENNFDVETKNTPLSIQLDGNVCWVELNGYKIENDNLPIKDLLELCQINENRLEGPIQKISIFEDQELMVPVKALSDLENLKPSLETYQKICTQAGVTGISIFAPETYKANLTLHTREFAPFYGYLEDPLCGMAAGAIFTYLNAQKPSVQSIAVEQGRFCGTNGIIHVAKTNKGIKIGGDAVVLEKS